ncbi:hypothetical protein ACIQF6_19665 [Kitasatospora sp. NPDC092948]|uniref:hypothetical protein n=1 Tax=Kitasatospora sp. NPDC092948 TaxID=3364088 RepID=UPI00382A9B2B
MGYKIKCYVRFNNSGEAGDPEPYGRILVHPDGEQEAGFVVWEQENKYNSTPTVASVTSIVEISSGDRPEEMHFSGNVMESDFNNMDDLLARSDEGLVSGPAGKEIKLPGGESSGDYVAITWNYE